VYLKEFREVTDATAREKQINAGSRERKIALVDSMNPDWRDLFGDLV